MKTRDVRRQTPNARRKRRKERQIVASMQRGIGLQPIMPQRKGGPANLTRRAVPIGQWRGANCEPSQTAKATAGNHTKPQHGAAMRVTGQRRDSSADLLAVAWAWRCVEHHLYVQRRPLARPIERCRSGQVIGHPVVPVRVCPGFRTSIHALDHLLMRPPGCSRRSRQRSSSSTSSSEQKVWRQGAGVGRTCDGSVREADEGQPSSVVRIDCFLGPNEDVPVVTGGLEDKEIGSRKAGERRR